MMKKKILIFLKFKNKHVLYIIIVTKKFLNGIFLFNNKWYFQISIHLN